MIEKTPVLMLSTGYEPLFQTTWRRALSAILGGRAEVIEIHDFLTIGTSRGPIPFPVKVRFITGIIAASIKKFSSIAPLTKRNLFIRDAAICQYCSARVTLKTGTIDHFIPKSKGGQHIWKNVVLACTKCNQKKGSKMPANFHLKVSIAPREPIFYEIINDVLKT
jgi:5-methylcytosine-specific restriction endonuclease McrA